MLHFVRNCRCNELKREGTLSAEEVQEARLLLLCQVQKNAFGETLNHLERGGRLSGLVELWSLDVFLDERTPAVLGPPLRDRIVLPAAHHFVELLIRNAHQQLLLLGCQETLTQLCEKF